MWLRDVLPDFIPNARIATYSYESDWRKRDIKTSLRQCGEQLLNVLHQNRLSEKVREILPSLARLVLLNVITGISTTVSVYRT